MLESLQKVLKEKTDKETVIVFQLFDNDTHYGTNMDGSASKPYKQDGAYHIKGELQMAGREKFKELLATATPLLRAGGEKEKLVLVPLVRYVTAKCCSNPAHKTNFDEETWGTLHATRLTEAK
jgi:hypothetical protein